MLRLSLSLGILTVSVIAPTASAQLLTGDGTTPLTFATGEATGEVVATPVAEGDAGSDEATEDDATTVTANYQPESIATYDTRSGGWLPDCNATSTSWMPEIEPPAGYINCNCNGAKPGARCRLWRSYVKPTDPSIDQRCVLCVKEPCLGYETVEEEHRAVLYRCFESSEPFRRHGCEAGQWYEEKGAKRVRKLHPCEIKVPVKYQKPVVKYRDVYYYIQCDHTEVRS